MPISTFVRICILIFLRHLLSCELSFTYCEFGTVAILIIDNVVIHRMLTLISYANLQCIDAWSCHSSNIQTWWTVDRRRVQQSIMTNVTWRRFDQSAKQLTVGHTTIWNLNSWSAFGIVINVIQIVQRFAVFQFNDFNMSAARHFKF